MVRDGTLLPAMQSGMDDGLQGPPDEHTFPVENTMGSVGG